MAETPDRIDISSMPELVRVAEEVRRSNTPRVLRRDDEDVAMVVPLHRRRAGMRKTVTEADREAFLSAAGAWKGIVDTEQLKADINESRRISSRPPVEL